MSIRNKIDITPWNKEGYSAFGLKRHQSKLLALIFIISGLLLAFPAFIPSPDDIINFMLANFLFKRFPTINYTTWLLFTYTLIAWPLLFIGFWIYPHNTQSLINGSINKFKRFFGRWIRSPKHILVSIIFFWLMYNLNKWYILKGG